MLEEWRPCPSKPLYAISNYGRLKRIAPGRGTRAGRILNPSTDNFGYKFATFTDGRMHTIRIHRLVAEAFLGPAEGREVNHVDGDGSNNRVDNLEYVTPQANRDHARVVLGRFSPATRPNVKLTQEQVDEIRSLRYKVSERDLAWRYGVSRSAIAHVQQGNRWKKAKETPLHSNAPLRRATVGQSTQESPQ